MLRVTFLGGSIAVYGYIHIHAADFPVDLTSPHLKADDIWEAARHEY